MNDEDVEAYVQRVANKFKREQIAPSFIKMAEKYISELKLPSIQENKLFSLNKSIKQFLKEALIETWNPEESFVSLSKFMINNGMNIQPLPKVKIISNDEENASTSHAHINFANCHTLFNIHAIAFQIFKTIDLIAL